MKSRTKYVQLKPAADFSRKSDDFHDEQYEEDAPVKAPVCSIVLAVFLFTAGSVMILLGALMLAGVVGDYGGRTAPLLIVGTICFLPGAYSVRIAYYAWRGHPKFSFADLPSYD